MKFSQKLLTDIGVTVLAMIEQNIAQGVDVHGQKFAYSEKPFYRPYDPQIVKKLGGKSGKGKFYEIVKSKSTGKLGMIILGGYKQYKQKVNPQAANDFLTFSGKMLRNLKIIKAENNQVIIGFTDPIQAQKAFWLNISGAGRSRKLWKFLGLRKEQWEQLKKRYGLQITAEMSKLLLDNVKQTGAKP
ncbi:hypothetical protein Calab_1517 [Caldithrix abyssi DSM 13497]|uniref:Uncharacterized protein n=1 Tax=Caldithrix abyssi DSM 13497 TaxID=880073 RepID=H1XQJ1_CALAY|nr:hypothetical protein [Caldithrix abyssi]APF16980.1 hypothetical protein Cabys_229 [Caldithrix abyssi DSM 13497]APF20331.1 hypothetical protein Cabys_3585 [Caldithrix abyssi DSM 13497]EHO40381.1 hypothetical protein Calab_0742 [Caldithrix abyssi DSM 13497]EHO41137.1 hypothetical protein Calab_1517 [Caldithrix abyssi DSM 13497]